MQLRTDLLSDDVVAAMAPHPVTGRQGLLRALQRIGIKQLKDRLGKGLRLEGHHPSAAAGAHHMCLIGLVIADHGQPAGDVFDCLGGRAHFGERCARHRRNTDLRATREGQRLLRRQPTGEVHPG